MVGRDKGMSYTKEEEEGEELVNESELMVGSTGLMTIESAPETAEGVPGFHHAPNKKVEFEMDEEEEEEEEEFWDDHDSFPEFPPGEVPDFLAGGKDSKPILRKADGQPPLYKHRSWSNDSYREEAWLRRKGSMGGGPRRSKSVTDEDLDELRGCIDLGFRFDGQEDRSLSDTIPALDLYYAVNRQYADCVSKSSASDCSGSPGGSPHNFFEPGDSPQLVKARLKQWAQVVACSVRHCR
ncbi:uncharacterized protein LOC116258635 [Nymphaea colorata]|nr:uncharacterized protein LOC116258635 [Nymphaea colorata]